MDRNRFELYFISRKLESARTLNKLEKTWAEIADKNLKPDDYIIKQYHNKKNQLEGMMPEPRKPEP